MGILDWCIVAGLVLALCISAALTRQYNRSVADFLAANRCAGRYLLAVAGGMAAIDAITFIAFFENVYSGGLTNTWWAMGSGFIGAIALISGWIVYRFRQTRALTLAQFLEMRYSRRFRIFTGMICWLSGIINFGIFPSVGARFFMSAFGIPPDATFAGLSVYMLFLIGLIGIAYVFTMLGGQITVIATDFLQGLFCNISMVVIMVVAIVVIGSPGLRSTLLKAISSDNQKILQTASQMAYEDPDGIEGAREWLSENAPEEKQQVLLDSLNDGVAGAATSQVALDGALEYYRNSDSLVHPFKIKGKRDLNFWFYLMSFWLTFYAGRIWQGSQGYNASALTPHEARMGNILSTFRALPLTIFCVVLPICALTFFNAPQFADAANQVRAFLGHYDNANLFRQMATPVAMMAFLPAGIKGMFVAMMLAAFISTHDTYMHSWGSIFIQDVVMPFRKKPLSQKSHMMLLRLSIFGVCVFIFIFSMIFRQTEYIVMFWNITGAIFTGGAGAVVIGGLYWKRGTTGAAWAAMITGSVLSVGSIFLRQIHVAHPFENPVLLFIASKNGMVLAFWSGIFAMAIYAVLSLLAGKEHNMDKLLHRGKYAVESDDHTVHAPVKGWRALFGVNKEFTRGDRIVYGFATAWIILTAVTFFIGTVKHSFAPASDEGWLIYWKIHLGVFFVLSVITTIWFAFGGIRDLMDMIRRLNTTARDQQDDGTVLEGE